MRFVEPERLMSCVHCGLCLASCPTYVELGTEADSPRGRIHLMRALEDGSLEPTAEVARHLDLCLGCRACETACPSGVPYGALIEAARPYVHRRRSIGSRLARRALAQLLGSPRLLRPLALLGGRPWLRSLARRSPWIAYATALPPRRRRRSLASVLEPEGRARGSAVLVTGCVADALFAETNRATAALLQRAGVRVIVPRQAVCCGALALHLGLADRAQRQASVAAAVLDVPGVDWVVTNAAGCGAQLAEYRHLLGDGPHAAAVAAKTRDALTVLAELGLPAAPRGLDATVAVHDPCHLAHGQGVREPARRLLASIPGVRMVELEESDWCCGSAGTYNLTERAMAGRLLARKLDRIARSGAAIVAAANPGCLLQMRAGAMARGLDVRIEHPIDLLARAHGVDE